MRPGKMSRLWRSARGLPLGTGELTVLRMHGLIIFIGRPGDGMETPATRVHATTFTPYDSADRGRRDSLGISPSTLHKVGMPRILAF